MPRPKVMRAELAETNIIVNEFGIEVGRLTVNGILVLNLAEMYFEIERWSAFHSGKCSLNHLNNVFSRTGTWGADPAVYGAVNELVDLKLLSWDVTSDGRSAVVPLISSHAAVNKIPAYTTLEETHAGLEHINE